MKIKIRKLCTINAIDDAVIQELQNKVLTNVDNWLPDSDSIKIIQILNTETRISYTTQDVHLLKHAIKKVQAREVILMISSSGFGT